MPEFALKIEPAEAFATARGFFRAAGFDDVSLCRALAVADMSSIGEARWAEGARDSLPPLLRLCVDLFLRGLKVPFEDLRTQVEAPSLDALCALGLIRPSKQQPGAATCPVWLYPVRGFVVASDRRDAPDDESLAPGNDIVFPAIYGLTSRFLDLLPDAAGRDVLDLCGGTGIGAMLMARSARSAATADLAPRAAAFATFNARLNEIPVESLCGDLYEPAAGRTFDVVTAHPPFVPNLGERMTFRDGGEAGEDITRRIVEGLPAHLRPGGLGLIVCWARDTEAASFEQRAAEWLGAARDEFDVIFGLEKAQTAEDLVAGLQKHRQCSPEEFRALRDRLQRLQTRRFVYGALLVRRAAAGAAAIPPVHIGIDRSARAGDFEPLFAWRRERVRPGFEERLARSRPRLAANLELQARYAVQDGELVPAGFTFSTDAPFRCGVHVDGWMVPMIARLTGRETVDACYRAATAAGEVKGGFPLEGFVALVADFVGKGFLEVELAE